MTTDLSLKEFAPHEIDNLRKLADRLDWMTGQRVHALIDAYEGIQDVEAERDEAIEEKEAAEADKDAAETAQNAEEAKNIDLQAELDWLYEMHPASVGVYPGAKPAVVSPSPKRRSRHQPR